MNAAAVEAFLARLYVDDVQRARFLADPVAEALSAGLDEDTARALAGIDRPGLELAAASFSRKRILKAPRIPRRPLRSLLRRFLGYDPADPCRNHHRTTTPARRAD